jgi:hypothetical protein
MLAELVLCRHLRGYTLSRTVLVMMSFSADIVKQESLYRRGQALRVAGG